MTIPYKDLETITLQRKNYSGKQKRHTKKNQLIVMPSGKEIVDVVVGETGATVDITIWRKQRSSLEASQRFQGDKAYAGEPLINTPHKKPREGPQTPAQKRENKAKAKKRIVVEHLIIAFTIVMRYSNNNEQTSYEYLF